MAWAALQRESANAGSFIWRFLSLLGILGVVSGEGFSSIVISSPGAPFQGPGLHSLVSDRAGGL